MKIKGAALTVVRAHLVATFEVASHDPEDHKAIYECIEEAVDKLREIGSCEVTYLGPPQEASENP
jgi:hypothetical protein